MAYAEIGVAARTSLSRERASVVGSLRVNRDTSMTMTMMTTTAAAVTAAVTTNGVERETEKERQSEKNDGPDDYGKYAIIAEERRR